jgi:hypothetical protein
MHAFVVIMRSTWCILFLDFIPGVVWIFIYILFRSYICNKRVLCMYRNSIRQLFKDSTIIDKQTTVSYTGTDRHFIKQTTGKHSDKTEQMFSTQKPFVYDC